MKAPPLILRKMTILSGSKNQHTDIGRRSWRTGNTLEAGDPVQISGGLDAARRARINSRFFFRWRLLDKFRIL
jgi:hypothetical protein